MSEYTKLSDLIIEGLNSDLSDNQPPALGVFVVVLYAHKRGGVDIRMDAADRAAPDACSERTATAIRAFVSGVAADARLRLEQFGPAAGLVQITSPKGEA